MANKMRYAFAVALIITAQHSKRMGLWRAKRMDVKVTGTLILPS